MIERMGIEQHVKLLGWKTQEEIKPLLQEAHVLVAPSLTSESGDQEGIPNVIKETMASGLPVISTFHSGIPELVQEGISGFLVPERDTNQLAEKIKYLIEHQEIWAEMGQAGHDHVEKNYNIERLNDQLIKLYQMLLNK